MDMSENSEAASLLESMKAAQESQMRSNDVNTQVLHGLMDKMSKMNNADKVDKSFERITTKILLEQKVTDFPAIPESRTETSLSIWLETISRLMEHLYSKCIYLRFYRKRRNRTV